MLPDRLTLLFALVNFCLLFMLSFLKFTNPLRVNQKGNLWFGLFLLFWASYWIDEVFILATGYPPSPYEQFIIRIIQGFTPFVLYLSVKFYTRPSYKFSKTVLIYLLLPLSYIFLLFFSTFGIFIQPWLKHVLFSLFLGQAMFFSVISYLAIVKHQKTVLQYSSDTESVNLFWMERILVILLLLVVISLIYNVLFNPGYMNLFMNILFLVLILYISFYSLRQKEVFPFSETAFEEVLLIDAETALDKDKIKIIPDSELIEWKNRLNQFMLSRKPFLDPELNLVKLASLFGTSPHRLSYIINSAYNINFSIFINNYRIDEAKTLLLNPKLQHYSVLGIAFESGFNSKTTFNNTFKKITGITPSEFRKQSSTL